MRFRLNSALAAAAVAAAVAALTNGAAAQSGTPIKIGFSMAMTGGLAANRYPGSFRRPSSTPRPAIEGSPT